MGSIYGLWVTAGRPSFKGSVVACVAALPARPTHIPVGTGPAPFVSMNPSVGATSSNTIGGCRTGGLLDSPTGYTWRARTYSIPHASPTKLRPSTLTRPPPPPPGEMPGDASPETPWPSPAALNPYRSSSYSSPESISSISSRGPSRSGDGLLATAVTGMRRWACRKRGGGAACRSSSAKTSSWVRDQAWQVGLRATGFDHAFGDHDFFFFFFFCWVPVGVAGSEAGLACWRGAGASCRVVSICKGRPCSVAAPLVLLFPLSVIWEAPWGTRNPQ